MIKVENQLKVYEADAAESCSEHVLLIKSHRIFSDRVIIEVGGREYTLAAKDLKAAIDNATNTVRF